jgi:ribonuclease BN (tRNA processing enzyme)
VKLPRRQFLHLAAGAAALPFAPHVARAQTPPQPKTGTRLITLGTAGGPVPRPHRAQFSNLLIVNGTLYLIDAGDGVARRLVKAGMKILDVGTIFITHNHDDHTAGLGTLLSVEWDYQRKTPVNVYGPPGTEALVKGAMQYFSVNAEIRWAEGRQTPLGQVFVGHDIGTGAVYTDANVNVIAAENTHFHLPAGSPPFGKHKSYSYRFETSERTIVFTGDTGPSDAVTQLAKGADILLSEVISVEDTKQALIKNGLWQGWDSERQIAYMRHLTEEHLTPEEVGKMATRANVKIVVLSHLTPTLNDNDDYKGLADEVRRHFSGQVQVANDLMEF